MSKNYQSISDVRSSIVWRLFGIDKEIDWLYGVSRWNYRTEKGELKPTHIYGMPVGKISIWMGEGGVGKSRLAIHVAKKVVAKYKPNKVLYFQNEVDISTFAGWVGNNKLENFYCSNATSLSEQIEIIKEIKPDLVFIDSINLIDEFNTGTDSSIKTIMDAYREVIKETNDETRKNVRSSSYAHVIFLCQLSKDGSAKGSTALTHLSDTTITITKQNNCFKMAIGDKHRYGRTGDNLYSLWRHTDAGVERISNNRYKDKQWCIDNNYVAPAPPPPSPYIPAPRKKRCSVELYEDMKTVHGHYPKGWEPDPTMAAPEYEGMPLSSRRKMDLFYRDGKQIEPELTFWQKVKRDTFKW